jgi:hypothetical protein
MMMLALGGIEGAKGLKDLFSGGEDPEFASFEGERPGGVSVDPRDLLMHGLLSTGRAGQKFEDFASQPVTLRSAFAQTPQSIKGSSMGLPFDIGGGFGEDPALKDPSMLTLPGFDFHGIMPQLAPQPEGTANPRQPRMRRPGAGAPTDDSEDALMALDMLAPSQRARA